MKKILFILSSVALVFTACQKEENTVAEAGDFELTATIEQQVDGTDTKTSLSSGSILWTAGDAIMVFDANGKKDKLVAQSGGVTSTSFKEPTEKVKDDGFSNTGDHYAIYPYGDGVSCTSGTITFTLPSTQTYAEGTFGQGANVAVASIGTTTSFYNVCGVLKLQLTGTSKVSKIELRGMKSEKLWGSFSTAVSATPTCVAGDRETGDDVLTLNCETPVELSSTAKTFYIVVPQGVFTSGFMATVYGTTGSVSTTYFGSMSTTNANTINRSKVRAMNSKAISLGYQRLQYLGTTGTQYIDTGVKGNQDTKLEVKVSDVASGNQRIAGSYSDETHSISFGLNGLYIRFGNQLGSSTSLAGSLFSIDKTGIYKDGATWKNWGAVSDFETNTNLYIGTTTVALTGANCRYYYVKIYNGGTLSRSFIPAKSTSGSACGMFDLVSGTLYTNSGSDSFTEGPAVTE